jgi:hypothetical protein
MLRYRYYSETKRSLNYDKVTRQDYSAVFFLFCHNVRAQRILIANEVDSALRSHCLNCSIYHPSLPAPDFLNLLDDNVNQSFHHCHHALKTANLQQASHYVTKLLDDIEHTSNNDLYVYAIFLQAKIGQSKGSSEEAIKYYRQYLSYKPADLALNYNAYTSMVEVFQARQDLLAVSKVLDDLHTELSFQKKSC